MANLTKEQHDYLMAAYRLANGKNGDEVLVGDEIVTDPAGVEKGREMEIMNALRSEGLLKYATGSGVAYITPSGFEYCQSHQEEG